MGLPRRVACPAYANRECSPLTLSVARTLVGAEPTEQFNRDMSLVSGEDVQQEQERCSAPARAGRADQEPTGTKVFSLLRKPRCSGVSSWGGPLRWARGVGRVVLAASP